MWYTECGNECDFIEPYPSCKKHKRDSVPG